MTINNEEIINNIYEIYNVTPANKIHNLIAKHFIPSIEEKKIMQKYLHQYFW